MKKFLCFLSALVTFVSLSTVCEPTATPSNAPDMIAITSLADISAVDSITDGAVYFSETSEGPSISLKKELTPQEMKEIESIIPVKIMTDEDSQINTASDLIKYLVSVLGGLLTSIILWFLNKKWPEIFPSKKVKNYFEYPKK